LPQAKESSSAPALGDLRDQKVAVMKATGMNHVEAPLAGGVLAIRRGRDDLLGGDDEA
jgi:hypothetical protein